MATILAIDTSAKPVSCAVVRNGQILGSFYANTGLTHSQTLMVMLENVLNISGLAVEQLDALAVNAGPGSFTGVRIGVSAVKGLAFTHKKPCVSVSTLESMAENVAAGNALICGVMDARCQQVYTALFERTEAGETVRLTEDEAISLTDLAARLAEKKRPIILVGDGAEMCYNVLKEQVPCLSLAPPSVRFQNAAATAVVAHRYFEQGVTVSAEELLPIYLRLPQAERELNSRLAKEQLK